MHLSRRGCTAQVKRADTARIQLARTGFVSGRPGSGGSVRGNAAAAERAGSIVTVAAASRDGHCRGECGRRRAEQNLARALCLPAEPHALANATTDVATGTTTRRL
ncbi:unnamed protein product [Lampetra fluviatilis]